MAPLHAAGLHLGNARMTRPSGLVKASSTVLELPSNELIIPKYCESVNQTRRRPTRTVKIGSVNVGSKHKIALQTMTTTDTNDVQATVDQVKKCADAGADMVRITVQGKREARACFKIREQLLKDNYDTPLVADIHFQPTVAMMVSECFQKIRVNPGNYADGRKTFEEINYDDPQQFEDERAFIEETFTPLVLKCKELGTAMRIGTNHGSLSARILSFYGDTPKGMVASAFEFAEVCRKHDYHNFLFSMKASNPLVMVQAYRLLAEEMYTLNWDYPLHLGVTGGYLAGEGEDGRMKSAIGIGALLMDGLGDTIRVSLTEDPEYEMDPCQRLANIGTTADSEGWGVEPFEEITRDTHSFGRRIGELPVQVETDGEYDYRALLHRDGTVYSVVTLDDLKQPELLYSKLGCKLAVGMPFKDIATSDCIIMPKLPPADASEARKALKRLQEVTVHVLSPISELAANPLPGAVAMVPLKQAIAGVTLPQGCFRIAVVVDGTESADEIKAIKGLDTPLVLLNTVAGASRVHSSRRVFEILSRNEINTPVLHYIQYDSSAVKDEIVMNTGSWVGGLLVDGLGDGAVVEAPSMDLESVRLMTFGLLQGSRMRNIKTEYVSCPSCGRTLFNLQEVTDQIRTKTGHLPGVAIAVMGCIVNGPGEMADADFGYVGGAPGKIDLYVGKEVVRRSIPNEEACDQLVELIKEHGRWVEPEVKEEESVLVAA
eukprot:gene27677-7318_t